MTAIVEVTTTTETQPQAVELVRLLVEQRLVACGQVTGPIHSIYRWQGEICESPEYRCTLKTSPALVDQLIRFIDQHHPYDTPEILVVNVKRSSDAYAQWLHQQLER